MISPVGICIGNTDSRHFKDLSSDIYRFAPLWFKPGDAQRWEVQPKCLIHWLLVGLVKVQSKFLFMFSDFTASMRGFPRRTTRSSFNFTSVWFRIVTLGSSQNLTVQSMNFRSAETEPQHLKDSVAQFKMIFSHRFLILAAGLLFKSRRSLWSAWILMRFVSKWICGVRQLWNLKSLP